MVAISLYRGNLHRVPDVPRRWVVPTPTISLKDFRKLLARRSKALGLLDPSNLPVFPNPKSPLHLNSHFEEKTGSDVGKLLMSNSADNSPSLSNCAKSPLIGNEIENLNLAESPSVFEEKEPEEVAQPHSLASESERLSDENEKRKEEIEEKLNVLKTRKHNLVQALKQLLSVEEHLNYGKDLSANIGNDFATMNREMTPRLGPEANIFGNGEIGETEDKNVQLRRLPRACSVSPPAESPIRRPLHQSSMTLPSPSRFAPALAPLPMAGTNFAASSPSPAASGGTSTFRDTRQQSPWS